MKKIKALVLSLLSLSVVGAFSGCSFEALLGMMNSSSESTPTNSESSTPDESTPDESTPDDGGEGDVTPDVPAADSLITIAKANELGLSKEHNKYTSDKFYVEGTVKSIDMDKNDPTKYSAYGNMYIEDAEGNTLYVYGVYGSQGKARFDSLKTKPAVGDTVKFYGVIGQYNGTAQMKNGWTMEINGEAQKDVAVPLSGSGTSIWDDETFTDTLDYYVIKSGNVYVATAEEQEANWSVGYTIVSDKDGTYTLDLIEEWNNTDAMMSISITGADVTVDEEGYPVYDGFSFPVKANTPVNFTISCSAEGDESNGWQSIYYDTYFSLTFDKNTFEADGSQLAPITLENGATYTVGASNAYYNFTAPSAGYYKLTVNADWSVVADNFNFYDADSNALLRGAAVEIAEGETIAFYAANYISEGWDTIPTSWTFTFGADVANDDNFDTPAVLGSYETPLEIYMTGDYEITIPAAEKAYYVVLCDAFQFVVPTGTVAEIDYEITASGEVVAFKDYNMMWNSQLLVCFHIADRTATEDLTVSFTVTDYVAEDGGDDVEGNYIEVTTTDNYGFFDLYSFTAEEAGTYTFTVPAGLGFTSKAAYDAWDAPEVDFYANESGDDVTVTLAAGETYEFYVGSLIKGDWIITWTVGEAGEDEGEGEEVSLVLANGENTVVITAEDIASEAQGALYTYTATADGFYSFKSNSAGAKIYDANMMMLGIGSANLTAGETYTILVWSPMGAGTYTLTIEAPVVEEGGEEEGGEETGDPILVVGANTVTIDETNNSVESGVAYTFTPDANGTCQFKGNLMAVVYDEDFEEVAKTSGKYELEAGIVYTVVFYNFMPSYFKPGDYTITVDFEAIVEESGEGDGSLANPFAIDDIFAEPLVVAANSKTQIYYTFTLTEAATITLTFDNADTWFSVDNTATNKRVVGGRLTDSYTGNFEAGTYIMAIGTWDTPELTLTLTCTKA